MEYLTTKEFATKYNITSRMASNYCKAGQIAGAIKKGKTWLIPIHAKKPLDRRTKTSLLSEDFFSSNIENTTSKTDMEKAYQKYGVSDLGEILGITRETIRYYEKNGLINVDRNEENNYRSFDGFDIFKLMTIDFYKQRGFTNNEINYLSKISEPNELSSLFEEKKEELENIVAHYKNKIRKLEDTKKFIDDLDNTYNTFAIRNMPNIEIKSTFASFSDFQEYKDKIFSKKDFSQDDVLSNLIRIFFIEKNKIVGSQMALISTDTNNNDNPQKCIYIKISSNNNNSAIENTLLHESLAWAEHNNYVIKNKVFVFLRLIMFGEEAEHNFYEIFIPIEN